MTPYEVAQLRIKCVEIFVVTCSKAGLESDVAFEKGNKLFEIVKRDIAEAQKGQAVTPPVEMKQSSKTVSSK